MTSVAVVACDHGLGHVRRSLLVARELVRRGAEVTLLAPPAAVDRAARVLSDGPTVPVVDFASATSPEALRRGDPVATRWHERLPDLAGFDAVVADTLPEVLHVRSDAVLVAQFWWHDVLDGLDPALVEDVSTLLAAHAGPVLGSVPFAMPAVTRLAGFVGVGLFGPGGARPSSEGRDTLLVTGGTTTVLDAALADVVRAIAARGPGIHARVAVEPRLLPADAPTWMRPAGFGGDELATVAAALVRPGLGIVTDLLWHGVPVACVRETGNAELEHNASALVRLGAGLDLGQLVDGSAAEASALAGRLDGLDDLGRRDGSERTVPPAGVAPATLGFDGAVAVADVVLGA